MQRGYTYNFTKTNSQGIEINLTSKYNLNYIDIPLNFRFSTEVGPGKLNVLVGPKFGIGLSGNWKGVVKSSFMGQTFSENIDQKVTFGSNDTCTKTLDIGVGFGLGYEIEKFHFQAMYTLGLTNNVNNPTKSEKTTQNMIAFSVGYRFNDN